MVILWQEAGFVCSLKKVELIFSSSSWNSVFHHLTLHNLRETGHASSLAVMTTVVQRAQRKIWYWWSIVGSPFWTFRLQRRLTCMVREFEWDMSLMNKSCFWLMRHVSRECVISLLNESYFVMSLEAHGKRVLIESCLWQVKVNVSLW